MPPPSWSLFNDAPSGAFWERRRGRPIGARPAPALPRPLGAVPEAGRWRGGGRPAGDRAGWRRGGRGGGDGVGTGLGEQGGGLGARCWLGSEGCACALLVSGFGRRSARNRCCVSDLESPAPRGRSRPLRSPAHAASARGSLLGAGSRPLPARARRGRPCGRCGPRTPAEKPALSRQLAALAGRGSGTRADGLPLTSEHLRPPDRQLCRVHGIRRVNCVPAERPLGPLVTPHPASGRFAASGAFLTAADWFEGGCLSFGADIPVPVTSAFAALLLPGATQ